MLAKLGGGGGGGGGETSPVLPWLLLCISLPHFLRVQVSCMLLQPQRERYASKKVRQEIPSQRQLCELKELDPILTISEAACSLECQCKS